jgi:hypothetical protein
MNFFVNSSKVNLEIQSIAISPISVMQWFEILLEKCKSAFQQMVDGSLTCGILESISSQHHGSIDSAQLVSSEYLTLSSIF